VRDNTFLFSFGIFIGPEVLSLAGSKYCSYVLVLSLFSQII